MERLTWINGQLLPRAQATVSVFDHAALYGDGVFEGLRQYHGRVFEKTAHLTRLFASARALRLPIPYSLDQISAALEETLAANHLSDAYIRLVVTRGSGDLGISPPICSGGLVYIITDTIQLYPKEMYEQGMAVITASTIRNHPNALSPRIKSLNYLNNILAKWEAIDADVPEALMLNHLGFVCEGTADNIFLVHAGRLLTPPEEAGILAGITRGVVLHLARAAGLPTAETNLTRYDLYSADECFLTGTSAEIIPVTTIDKRPIGPGTPGPLTQKLISAFHAHVRNASSEPRP